MDKLPPGPTPAQGAESFVRAVEAMPSPGDRLAALGEWYRAGSVESREALVMVLMGRLAFADVGRRG